MYEEKSQWNKEVYQGYETSCTVAGELFSHGKTYSFGVRATAQGESGKESDSEFAAIKRLLILYIVGDFRGRKLSQISWSECPHDSFLHEILGVPCPPLRLV